MEQLNPGQIKKNIKQLKQRQEQYLYYLGQLAYQAGEQGKLEDTGMLDAYQTLKDIQVQMAQGEASLEEIKAVKEAAQKPRCAQCGEPLPKGAVFCAKCGTSQVATPPAAVAMAAPAASVPAGRPCSNCGAPLDEDAIFCGNCGARSGGETAAAPAPVEAEAPAAAPSPPAPEMATASPPQTAMEAEAPAQETPAQAEAAAAALPAPAVEEPAPSLEDTLACPKCGADVPDKDVIFCSACGTKVRE
jgi:hypothetical protein